MIILDIGNGGKYFRRLITNRKLDKKRDKKRDKTTNNKINAQIQQISLNSNFCKSTKKEIKQLTLEKIKNITDPIIVLTCHSAASAILDLLISHDNNLFNSYVYEPIIPTCLYLQQQKCQNVIVLSTTTTCKVRWHQRILEQQNPDISVSYICLPRLPTVLDNYQDDHKKIQLNILLQKLSNYKHLIEKCDCLVLGCSHFNGVEKNITQKLQQYHFSGKIINTEKILYQFMCKKNIG